MRSRSNNKPGRTPLRAALLAGATMLALAAGSGVAQASVITKTFDLNVYSTALQGFTPAPTGTAGTVTLTDDGSGTVHVNMSLNPNYTANTGASTYPFEFELAPSLSNVHIATNTYPIKWSGSTGTTGPTGGTLNAYQSGLSPNGGQFGTFNSGISITPPVGNGSNVPQYKSLDFDITDGNTGGFTINDFKTTTRTTNPPGGGVYFVADIFDTAVGTSGQTGLVGTINFTSTTTTNNVPEPGSLALLGTALIGLGFAVRRRYRRD